MKDAFSRLSSLSKLIAILIPVFVILFAAGGGVIFLLLCMVGAVMIGLDGRRTQTDASDASAQDEAQQHDDQAFFAEIARGNDNVSARRDAVYKLTNLDLLADIAQSDSDWSVRMAATGKLTDQKLLAKIAQSDEDSYVRYDAAEKLFDTAVLTKIVENDVDDLVRWCAAKKLTDPTLLTQLAQNDSFWRVRYEAVQKLEDQTLFAEIAQMDADCSVRSAARKKLTDEVLLTKIAKDNEAAGIIDKEGFYFNDPGGRFREIAVKLENKAAWEKRKLQITAWLDTEPGTVLGRISHLADEPNMMTPTQYDVCVKADYRLNRNSFFSAISQSISCFNGAQYGWPTDERRLVVMNNGTLEGVSKEQFDAHDFDFSDLTQPFL